MIYLIIKSYLTIIVSIAAGAVTCIGLGSYFIFRRPKPVVKSAVVISLVPKSDETISCAQRANLPNMDTGNNAIALQTLEAIAGDDVIATQLDLAHAYIEAGRVKLAKPILESVCQQGSPQQQQEAQKLLRLL